MNSAAQHFPLFSRPIAMDPVGVLRGHEYPVTALAAVTLDNGDTTLVSG